jgi:hypothetical protein
MKTRIRLATGAAVFAIVLQASSAIANPMNGLCFNKSSVTGPRWPVPCPENGFGSRTPVTLPADRPAPAGKSIGFATGNRTLPTIPTQSYIRPR